MHYRLLAIVIALIHAVFVLFSLAGGSLVVFWPSLVWLHFGCALYIAAIMIVGWRCPLTDLEISLRKRAGQQVEWNEFIYQYVWSRIGLTGKEKFVLPTILSLLFAFNSYPYYLLLK